MHWGADGIKIIKYQRKKIHGIQHFAHTIKRFIRAFIYNKQGFLTNDLINHEFLTETKEISHTDNILFWGCENLKELLTLKQELPSKKNKCLSVESCFHNMPKPIQPMGIFPLSQSQRYAHIYFR